MYSFYSVPQIVSYQTKSQNNFTEEGCFFFFCQFMPQCLEIMQMNFNHGLLYLHALALRITYSTYDNETHRFFKFWLVDTWIFADWRNHRAVTRLENVRQSSIRRGKKLGFQLYINTLLWRKKY